jgi:phage recombination protein Bet
MNAAVENAVTVAAVNLPEPVARRGIQEAQWRTLMNNLYPGAASESVLMVWDYCKARKLDPLKKPCHIVPMRVKDARTGEYSWRDVVMPGIYEYRTTAARTGQYLGHAPPIYGEAIDCKGVTAPEFCTFTVYRWNKEAGQRGEYPVTVRFVEVVATNKDGKPNDRWSKAPLQMLTKCAEAASLREAFPDEFGGEPTAEEMDGQMPVEPMLAGNPHDGIEQANAEDVDKIVGEIADIIADDGGHDGEIHADKYFAVHLRICTDAPLYSAVQESLKKRKILTASQIKALTAFGSKRFQERNVANG